VYKGTKPAAQPRTLRSNAESKNGGAGFESPPAYDTNAGVPAGTPGSEQYRDDAEQARVRKVERGAEPSPFK